MSNVKSSIQSNHMNQHKYNIKKLQMKTSSKGRQIIKPKKLLTTSSDDKQIRKKKIIKRQCTDISEELYELQSCATQPNILRDITCANNTQKIKRVILKTPNHVLSCISERNTSLSRNNYNIKQSAKQNTSPNELDSNISVNDQNLKRSVSYDTSRVLSKNSTERESSASCNYENFKLLSQNCEMVKLSESINGLKKNIFHSNDTIRVKTLLTMLENSSVQSLPNMNAQFINNVSNIPIMDNCQSLSECDINENLENKKHHKNTPILDIESMPIIFHEDLQESGKIRVLFRLDFSN